MIQGVKLMISVDCGITAVEEIKFATELGLDFIVTDHHEAGDHLPEATAILNPKQEGDTYPGTELSGVGVAYKLAQALPGKKQLGMLAQEVESTLPELVSTDKQGYKSIDYTKLTPILVEAVKELKAENESLRQRLEASINAGRQASIATPPPGSTPSLIAPRIVVAVRFATFTLSPISSSVAPPTHRVAVPPISLLMRFCRASRSWVASARS